MSEDAIIEPMRFEDLPWVYTIEETCFPEPWSMTQFEQELRSNLSSYFVVKIDGVINGYVGIMFILDEGHITTIAVHPFYRRRGLGSFMLLRCLKLAAAKGMRLITLEVRKSNLEGIEMYKKFGFAVTGRRIGYYSHGREDALIMDSPTLASPEYIKFLSRLEMDSKIK